MYDNICNALRSTSTSCIPTSGCNRSSQFVVPGWNDVVKDAHTDARHAYVTWRKCGQGPVCELMRTTRLRFKYALRQCHATEDTARADALAKHMSEKDTMSFWRSVKANSKSVPLTHTIYGVTGNDNISEMWHKHYNGILNCVGNDSKMGDVLSILDNIRYPQSQARKVCRT